jgi:hypothetical protein
MIASDFRSTFLVGAKSDCGPKRGADEKSVPRRIGLPPDLRDVNVLPVLSVWRSAADRPNGLRSPIAPVDFERRYPVPASYVTFLISSESKCSTNVLP